MTTTTPTLAEVAVASIKAIEQLDIDACRATTHPDAVNREAATEPPACRQPGPEGFYATAQWLHKLADDISWDIHEAIDQGDLVAVHTTMRGHQTNPHTLYDPDGQPAEVMPNLGRPFAVTQTQWFRMRDGLVVEHWANRDDLAMAIQLGWLAP
jgi:predicted SnoaL-like aldol condensation-catalyzing enzyme